MSYFQPVEHEVAILYRRGVFKQVPLATRDGFIYAALSSTSFIRLKADGSTSQPDTKLDALTWDGPLHRDEMGRLCTAGAAGRRITLLDGTARAALLALPAPEEADGK